MNEGMLVFAGLVAYAWIAKIQAPPVVVNAAGWVIGLILTAFILLIVLRTL